MVIANADKIRSVLAENNYSFGKISRELNLHEEALRNAANHRGYCYESDIDKVSDFFGLDKDYFYPTEEDIRCVLAYSEALKERRRELEKGLKTNVRQSILQELDKTDTFFNQKIILNGLLYFCNIEGVDGFDISEKSGLDLDTVRAAIAFNPITLSMGNKIVKAVGYKRVPKKFLSFPEKEKDSIPTYALQDMAQYAAELYSETDDINLYRPFYFWVRAGLAYGYRGFIEMPDWFVSYAKKERERADDARQQQKDSSFQNRHYFSLKEGF